ncbi:hypothetical protein IFM89_022761 [Coptis chinensis]|uniref:Protein kinase domain-containing protein n=1 Tax=Coptis chinensis TaxID=261450 RepID=A0A835MC21_9MAGN|nr:hypothetical protein IFM89_022761 [Coptis chinensis]
MIRKRQRKERVIVVLEGTKASTGEKGAAPLRWALRKVVNPKDELLVLTILNPLDALGSPSVGFCCIGDQQSSLPYEGDKYIEFSHEQINQRRQAYLRILRPYYDRCKNTGVIFQVKVAVGIRPMAIMIEEANSFKATWIIMDRCFSGDKSRLGGDFNTAVVNDNEEAEEHRLSCTPSDVSGNFRGKGIKINPRISDQLRQPVQPEGEPHVSNPRPLKLLKETVSQEEPHIRDSLPTTRVKNRFFHPSFPGNTSASAEVENEVTVKRFANESGYPLKINQVKEETGDAVSFELSGEESETPSIIEPIVEESLNLAKVESPRSGPSYYPEQSGRKEILKGGKGTSGSKRLKPSGARTSLYNNISFGRFSEAMLVLRQPLELSLEEIVELTGGFHPDCCISKHEQFELYDGFLRDPSFHAVVKRLNGDPTGVIEAEKRVTCSLFHRNIMELSAYHDSANVTALVYAIADKGTLDQYLYGSTADQVGLTFKNRMKIATEIGRCLRYMHEECPRGPVVHSNLQPCNIFLTHDFQPLVSGFGRAVWLQFEQVMTDRTNRYTCEPTSGFVSMELVKSDVFSFGVLLLRLFCLRTLPRDNKQLVELARPLLVKGAFHELLDQDIADEDIYEIYKVISVAIHCTKTKPLSRPSMSQASQLTNEHPIAC